jgi:hypothetical protein
LEAHRHTSAGTVTERRLNFGDRWRRRGAVVHREVGILLMVKVVTLTERHLVATILGTVRAFAAVTLAALFTSSCSGDSTGPGGTCSPETTNLNATITAGATVVFDWSPRCPVSFLLVESDGTDMWWISPFSGANTPANVAVDVANVIQPTVTYGQRPNNVGFSDGPRQLVPGRTYELSLWRTLPTGSTAQCRMREGRECLVTFTTFVR